jgi:hypothetical protein
MRMIGALFALALLGGHAGAQEATSAYTDLDLGQCSVDQTDDFGTVWACPGYRGIPVMVAESDLRFLVSYGLESTTEKAAEQSLPPFNTVGEKIEWRLAPAGGGLKPFATILRFRLEAEGEASGEVLVVTRLGKGATCQVAYIDARANPDANEKAREAADTLARTFDCDDAPRPFGPFKAW